MTTDNIDDLEQQRNALREQLAAINAHPAKLCTAVYDGERTEYVYMSGLNEKDTPPFGRLNSYGSWSFDWQDEVSDIVWLTEPPAPQVVVTAEHRKTVKIVMDALGVQFGEWTPDKAERASVAIAKHQAEQHAAAKELIDMQMAQRQKGGER